MVHNMNKASPVIEKKPKLKQQINEAMSKYRRIDINQQRMKPKIDSRSGVGDREEKGHEVMSKSGSVNCRVLGILRNIWEQFQRNAIAMIGDAGDARGVPCPSAFTQPTNTDDRDVDHEEWGPGEGRGNEKGAAVSNNGNLERGRGEYRWEREFEGEE
ncbi:hypothetical protein L218DRAFT_951437 [Marasmius fiardii PR-910]|nr:hypothetical protein L218DRAFT_951437 [Marasmius fiardii PR-910]